MHERISVNAICFPGADWRALSSHWRALGCHRVSLLSAPLLEDGVAAAQAALASGGYRVETIAHNFILGPIQAEEASWREPRARLSRLIEAAETLGARSIYMLTGGRGALDWDAAADAFAAALAPCVVQADTAGVPLLIENAPVVYPELHIALSLHDTVRLADRAGIGVCIDISNCWTEGDLKQSIERAMPRCRLVQVSDYVHGDRAYPCRAVPGDGAVPFKTLFGWMLDAGYGGGFDLELIGPRIDREGHLQATRRAADTVGDILRSLSA